MSRRDAFGQAKRDADIPMISQSIYRKTDLDDGYGQKILDYSGVPVKVREYLFQNRAGHHVMVQEHSGGHAKAATFHGLAPISTSGHGMSFGQAIIREHMVNTTSNELSTMNIMEFIDRRFILEKIFPQGLVEEVYLGRIMLSGYGDISINIHTRQQPAIPVEKWGIWGTDYNVIALELDGAGCNDATIKNWSHADYSKLHVSERDGKHYLYQTGAGWSVELDFDSFIYQRCSRYIDDSI